MNKKSSSHMNILRTVFVLVIAALAVVSCNKKKWNPASPQATDTPNIMLPTKTHSVTPTSTVTCTITLTSTVTPPYTKTITHTITLTSTYTITCTSTPTATFTPTFHWIEADVGPYISTNSGSVRDDVSMALDSTGNAYVTMNGGQEIVMIYRCSAGGVWSKDNYIAGNHGVGPYSAERYNGNVFISGAADDYVDVGLNGKVVKTKTIRPALWQRNDATSNWSMLMCGSGNSSGACPFEYADSSSYKPSRLAANESGLYMYYYLSDKQYGVTRCNGIYECFYKGYLASDSFSPGVNDTGNNAIYSLIKSAVPTPPVQVFSMKQGCPTYSGYYTSVGGVDMQAAGETVNKTAIYASGSKVIVAYTTGNGVKVDYYSQGRNEWLEFEGGDISTVSDCLQLKGKGDTAYLSFREQSSLKRVYVYKIDMNSSEMTLMQDGTNDFVISDVNASALALDVNGKPYLAYIEGGANTYIKIKKASY